MFEALEKENGRCHQTSGHQFILHVGAWRKTEARMLTQAEENREMSASSASASVAVFDPSSWSWTSTWCPENRHTLTQLQPDTVYCVYVSVMNDSNRILHDGRMHHHSRCFSTSPVQCSHVCVPKTQPMMIQTCSTRDSQTIHGENDDLESLSKCVCVSCIDR